MSLGFYFDMTRCSGCAACRTACQDRFDLFEVGFAPRRVHRYQTGTFPSVAGYVTSVSCNHCENPACVENCPTGAMFKNKDGLVLHGASSARKLKFKPHETEFLLCLMQTASDLSRKFTFGEAAELFRHYSEESFVAFYLSKKWDLMRPLGLLQI